MKDTIIDMVKDPEGMNELSVNMPSIESWEVDAQQTVNTWLLPANSKIQIKIVDLTFDFKGYFNLD